MSGSFCSRIRRYAGALLAGLLLSSAVVPALAQSDEERSGARAAAQQGLEAYREKRWADAVDFFNRAESLVQSPVHVLYLARSHAQLGKLVKARELYTKVARYPLSENAPKAFTSAQSDAQKELGELEPRLPHVTVVVSGEGAQQASVTQDGAAIPAALIGVMRPVDPGEHEYQAVTEKMASKAQKITVAEKARLTVTLQLEPRSAANPAPPPPAPATGDAAAQPATGPAQPVPGQQSPPSIDASSGGSKIPAIVAFGVGAVGIGAGVFFLLDANGKADDADTLCNPTAAGLCRKTGNVAVDRQREEDIQALEDDEKSARTLSVVGFVAGGVGVAAGVTLLILSGGSSPEPSPAQASIRPFLGLGSVGITGSF
jgi:hypothetical protein